MKLRTLQSIANTIARHLKNQSSQCLDVEDNCVYRGTNNSCAFGCLIPDELYHPNMEKKNIRLLLESFPKLLKQIGLPQDSASVKFYTRAQDIHDHYWTRRNEKFRDLCHEYKLQYRPN